MLPFGDRLEMVQLPEGEPVTANEAGSPPVPPSVTVTVTDPFPADALTAGEPGAMPVIPKL